MIRYALTCSEKHEFDSWFQSAEAYDRLRASGHINCSVCGSGDVEKLMMTPSVRAARNAVPAAAAALSARSSPIEEALAAMRRAVEENSDYVGMNFAAEARAIHDGDAPERAIHGEARADDAKRLLEDGIPVAPLPFLPRRKTN
jgi:hypothetical protein